MSERQDMPGQSSPFDGANGQTWSVPPAPAMEPKPAEGSPSASGPSAWRRFTRFFLDRLDRLSLVTKLVACTLIVLLIGAGGITYSIRQLVGNYLLDKMDAQLAQQSQLIYTGAELDLLKTGSDQTLRGIPNNYFMQLRDVNNRNPVNRLVPSLQDGVTSMPQLPAPGSTDVVFGEPFFTPSVVTLTQGLHDRHTLKLARSDWRVIALQIKDNGQTQGIAYIGLSLGDMNDTVDTLTRYCLSVGAAIVLLGASLSALIFQRALQPLKRIEKIAAKIAAGDLSQRIPPAPENTEVGSLSSSLNTMLARIESSFREQRETTEKMKRFVSDASHELRTPLAAIHGYAELYTMQRGLPGALERADESIEHIERSSQRMTVLVEDLLSLARLDEGRGIDMTQQVPLTMLTTDAADDLHALDPGREITRGQVRLVPAADGRPSMLAIEPGRMPSLTLTGDASRLRQVVTNIVGNIHRYTPDDSPAELGVGVLPASIAPEKLSRMPATDESLRTFLDAAEVGASMNVGTNYAVVRFVDHGPGVPDEARPQLFERFYTADPSRAREKGGTGLGLAIARSVVRAHRGFICATDTQGGGLTFTVILPMGRVETPQPDPAGAATQKGTGPRPRKDHGKDRQHSAWFGGKGER